MLWVLPSAVQQDNEIRTQEIGHTQRFTHRNNRWCTGGSRYFLGDSINKTGKERKGYVGRLKSLGGNPGPVYIWRAHKIQKKRWKSQS